MAAHYHFDLDTPFRKLPQRVRNVVLFGSGDEDIEVTYQIQSGATRGKKIKNDLPLKALSAVSRALARDGYTECPRGVGTLYFITALLSVQGRAPVGGGAFGKSRRQGHSSIKPIVA